MAELLVPADGAGGCFSVLSAGGLLPAAAMGIDIVRLLQGAAMMNERFRTAPPGDNPVLDYAGLSHVMEAACGANSSDIAPWASALGSTARWCDDLRFSHHDHAPEAVASGGLTINLVVDAVRRDRLVIPTSDGEDEAADETSDEADAEEAYDMSGKSFPELQSMVLDAAREAYAAEQRPSADLHLPAVDESTLGQFFQTMMLAAAIEERFIEVSPDGPAHSHTQKSK